MAFRREFFRRGDTFVAVRYIRLTSKERLEPGTVIEPGQFRLYQLRNWWQRRQIGVEGSKWVTEQLKRHGIGADPKPLVSSDVAELEPYKRDAKWVIPGFEEALSFKTKKAAAQWLGEEAARRAAAEAEAEAAAAEEAEGGGDQDEQTGDADGVEKVEVEGDTLDGEGEDAGEVDQDGEDDGDDEQQEDDDGGGDAKV